VFERSGFAYYLRLHTIILSQNRHWGKEAAVGGNARVTDTNFRGGKAVNRVQIIVNKYEGGGWKIREQSTDNSEQRTPQ
jgi:hypothetical protein